MKANALRILLLLCIFFLPVQSQQFARGTLDYGVFRPRAIGSHNLEKMLATRSQERLPSLQNLLQRSNIGIKNQRFGTPTASVFKGHWMDAASGADELPLQSRIVVDTAIVVTEQDTSRRVYSYTSQGWQSGEFTQRWNRGIWDDSLRRSFLLDSDGRKLVETAEAWINNSWNGTQQIRSVFDGGGRCIETSEEIWKEEKWETRSRELRSFDQTGSCIDYRYYFRSDSTDEWEHHFAVVWNETGYTTSDTAKHFKHGEFADGWLRTSIDDTVSGMSLGLAKEFVSGEWINTRRTTYVFNKADTTSVEIEEDWLDGAWANRQRTSYHDHSNEANGEGTSTQTIESWSDGSWKKDQRWVYAYGLWGSIGSSVEFWTNEQWGNPITVLSTDDLGRVVFYAWGKMNAEQNGFCGRSLYTYESPTQRTFSPSTCTTENLANGEWVPSQREVYDHDERGYVSSFHFEAWTGAAWSASDGDAYICNPDCSNLYFGKACDVTISYRDLVISTVATDRSLPGRCSLEQNYPNPFNPETVVRYQVPGVSGQSSVVSVKIYDLLGREVAVLVNEEKMSGTYAVTWNAKGMASGSYLYTLRAGEFRETRRMILQK